MWLLPIKKLNVSKLLVCYAHYSDLSIFRKKRVDTLHVDFCILHTCTMAYINGELKHGEAILLQPLSEHGVFFYVFLCFCWQIKKNKYPHNSIFTKTIHCKIIV